MNDYLTELEQQSRRLKALLIDESAVKDAAYDELAEQGARLDALERESAQLSTKFARECARSTALDFEATLYRDRYQKALVRLAAAGRAVTIANITRQYLTAIERRGSIREIETHLQRLREEVGFSLDDDVNPAYVMIIDLERELEALRRRHAELRDERDTLVRKLEDADGHAADWQELAEASDRKLVAAQGRLKHWECPDGN